MNEVYEKMLAAGKRGVQESKMGKRLGMYNTGMKKLLGTYMTPIKREIGRV